MTELEPITRAQTQSPSYVTCTDCGLAHDYRPIAVGEIALCQRCEAVLYRNRPHMVQMALALTLTGLILFILSNAFPLLGLSARGLMQEITLIGAGVAFWQQGYPVLAVLLLLTIVIFPLFELLSQLWILLSLQRHWPPEPAIFLFRWIHELKPWGMLEVFMLGMLVSVVKLGEMATLIVGPALWSFAFLILTMAVTSATLDDFSVWSQLKRCDGKNDESV
ncbi:paraquat-inducible protein A [Thiolinea disciformis]|uniref:paraquat-inducible protein A n=1 Tax=Thiolinea disciformis TaxID=125614 RepID=UPI000373F7DB|nr:paraquat-inducible protein A [Thiolinea disciformis]